MNNITSKLIGLFFIFMGVGYLGNQLDLWSFTIFFNGWWGCLIALLGFCSMIDNGITTGNTIVSALGIYFFCVSNDFISFRITFQFVIAIILIYIGIRLVFFKERKPFLFNEKFVSQEDSVDKKLYVHTSFGTRKTVCSDSLESCRIENVFGTVFVDLREADLTSLDKLSIESVFGSIDILVPANVNLKVKRENIFASCYIDDTHISEGYDVIVKETCVFGSIRIMKSKK